MKADGKTVVRHENSKRADGVPEEHRNLWGVHRPRGTLKQILRNAVPKERSGEVVIQ